MLLALASYATSPAGAYTSVGADESRSPSLTDDTASVTATATNQARRLLIVDDEDMIVSIWSNTVTLDVPLSVKRDTGSGRALDDGILLQYRELLADVDWTQRGLVYSRISPTR
jgi:hypothetical protein